MRYVKVATQVQEVRSVRAGDMSNIEREISFRCSDDCKQAGCPGHKMTVFIQTTSDVMIVQIDGKDFIIADPYEWSALKKLLKEINYYNFDFSDE